MSLQAFPLSEFNCFLIILLMVLAVIRLRSPSSQTLPLIDSEGLSISLNCSWACRPLQTAMLVAQACSAISMLMRDYLTASPRAHLHIISIRRVFVGKRTTGLGNLSRPSKGSQLYVGRARFQQLRAATVSRPRWHSLHWAKVACALVCSDLVTGID